MKYILFVALLCVFATEQQLVQKEEDRRELFVVALIVGCISAVAGGVATAVTTAALNRNGQEQAPVQQPVNVQVFLYQNDNGQWVPGPGPGQDPPAGPPVEPPAEPPLEPPVDPADPPGGMSTERRLLTARVDQAGPTGMCPAGTLKLPVGKYQDGGFRILDQYAKIGVTECSWWTSNFARMYNVVNLMPPGCFKYIKKSNVNANGIKQESVREEVQVPAHEEFIDLNSISAPKSAPWQKPVLVAGFGFALIMAALTTSYRKKQKQQNYSPLTDDIDEL